MSEITLSTDVYRNTVIEIRVSVGLRVLTAITVRCRDTDIAANVIAWFTKVVAPRDFPRFLLMKFSTGTGSFVVTDENDPTNIAQILKDGHNVWIAHMVNDVSIDTTIVAPTVHKQIEKVGPRGSPMTVARVRAPAKPATQIPPAIDLTQSDTEVWSSVIRSSASLPSSMLTLSEAMSAAARSTNSLTPLVKSTTITPTRPTAGAQTPSPTVRRTFQPSKTSSLGGVLPLDRSSSAPSQPSYPSTVTSTSTTSTGTAMNVRASAPVSSPSKETHDRTRTSRLSSTQLLDYLKHTNAIAKELTFFSGDNEPDDPSLVEYTSKMRMISLQMTQYIAVQLQIKGQEEESRRNIHATLSTVDTASTLARLSQPDIESSQHGSETHQIIFRITRFDENDPSGSKIVRSKESISYTNDQPFSEFYEHLRTSVLLICQTVLSMSTMRIVGLVDRKRNIVPHGKTSKVPMETMMRFYPQLAVMDQEYVINAIVMNHSPAIDAQIFGFQNLWMRYAGVTVDPTVVSIVVSYNDVSLCKSADSHLYCFMTATLGFQALGSNEITNRIYPKESPTSLNRIYRGIPSDTNSGFLKAMMYFNMVRMQSISIALGYKALGELFADPLVNHFMRPGKNTIYTMPPPPASYSDEKRERYLKFISDSNWKIEE
jgi:hypothetical protein